jgi:hypothetical protein
VNANLSDLERCFKDFRHRSVSALCLQLAEFRELPPALPELTASRDDERKQLLYLKPSISVPRMARDPSRLDFCSVRNNLLLESNTQFRNMFNKFSEVSVTIIHVVFLRSDLLQNPWPKDTITVVAGPSGVGKVTNMLLLVSLLV